MGEPTVRQMELWLSLFRLRQSSPRKLASHGDCLFFPSLELLDPIINNRGGRVFLGCMPCIVRPGCFFPYLSVLLGLVSLLGVVEDQDGKALDNATLILMSTRQPGVETLSSMVSSNTENDHMHLDTPVLVLHQHWSRKKKDICTCWCGKVN